MKLSVFVILLGLFFSCSNKKDYSSSSRATGWKSPEVIAAHKFKPKDQLPGPGLVFIEGGTFTMGRVQDDPMGDYNNNPSRMDVTSFYMDETEVTNLMYLEYLDWLKKVFPPSEDNYRHIYGGALPDTLVWRSRLGFNEVMVDNYLRHPAYSDYPVVGVNWVQAVDFCKWRTDRVNEKILQDKDYIAKNAIYNNTAEENFSTETYINAPTRAYGGNDSILTGGSKSQRVLKTLNDSTPNRKNTLKPNLYAERESGLLYPEYRLPTEVEWEYAALALSENRDYNNYKGKKKYPWSGDDTQGEKGKFRGKQLANFKQGDGEYAGIPGSNGDGGAITKRIKSFPPNDLGLYDMAGNVAEWVADTYRPIIDDDYNDLNYFRGNVYTKKARNDDGTYRIVQTDSILFDTLPNGKIVERQLPGEIMEIPITEDDAYLRTNYSGSDNRDFMDGDSGKDDYYNSRRTNSNSERMYNSPQHKVYTDSTGKIIREYDKSNDRTTLISNEAKVYKGGSWQDLVYWLDPAQRRFLPQYMATDYIGFRCAMSRVGSKSIYKGKKRN